MFKNASRNEQSRRDRTALNANTKVIALDVWKEPKLIKDKRAELVARKQDLEQKSIKLRHSIGLAKLRYAHNDRGQVNYATLIKWETEYANIRSEVSAIDKRFAEMKLEQRLAVETESTSFAEVFKEIAKEMLVDEIYNRLCTATIHRIGEYKEKLRG